MLGSGSTPTYLPPFGMPPLSIRYLYHENLSCRPGGPGSEFPQFSETATSSPLCACGNLVRNAIASRYLQGRSIGGIERAFQSFASVRILEGYKGYGQAGINGSNLCWVGARPTTVGKAKFSPTSRFRGWARGRAATVSRHLQ